LEKRNQINVTRLEFPLDFTVELYQLTYFNDENKDFESKNDMPLVEQITVPIFEVYYVANKK
jgi:hypothetical protein